MPMECYVCHKAPVFGHTISHAHNVRSRKFYPNLQSVRILEKARSNACASARAACGQGRSRRRSRRAQLLRSRPWHLWEGETPPPSLSPADISKTLRVHPVHLGEIFQTREEDRRLHQFLKTAARGFEDGGDVLHNLPRLLANPARYHRPCLRVHGICPETKMKPLALIA